MNEIEKENKIKLINQQIEILPTIKDFNEWKSLYIAIQKESKGLFRFDKQEPILQTLKNLVDGSKNDFNIINHLLQDTKNIKFLFYSDEHIEAFEHAYKKCLSENPGNFFINDDSYLKDFLEVNTKKLNLKSKNSINNLIVFQHRNKLIPSVKENYAKFEDITVIKKTTREDILDREYLKNTANLSVENKLYLYLQIYCLNMAKTNKLEEIDSVFLKMVGNLTNIDEHGLVVRKTNVAQEKPTIFMGALAGGLFSLILNEYKNAEIKTFIASTLKYLSQNNQMVLHHISEQDHRIMRGIEFYLRRDWDASIFYIVPKLEYALKRFFPEVQSIKKDDTTTIYEGGMLNDLLNHLKSKGDDEVQVIINFIKLCLTSRHGTNIRNNSSHGNSNLTDNVSCASLSIMCLILLSLIKEENGKFTIELLQFKNKLVIPPYNSVEAIECSVTYEHGVMLLPDQVRARVSKCDN